MKHTLIAPLVLTCMGCASHSGWQCVRHGEHFLLTAAEPTYKRLDVSLLSVEADGTVTIRWNKSGTVEHVAMDEAVGGSEADEGFVRLITSRPNRRLAVFETGWVTD